MSILGAISAGLGIVSTIMGAKSSSDAGKANAASTREAAKWNAKISEYDALVMEQQAKEIEYVTGLQLSRHAKLVDAFMGKQRTKYAKSGVALGTGSPVDVMAYNAEQANLDAQTILYEGEKGKARALSAAKRYRMLKNAGLRDAAATASIIEDTANDKAMSTIVQGASNFLGIASDNGWFI